MLSIVPLMNGGGLFETGAGGWHQNMWCSSKPRTTYVGTLSVSSSLAVRLNTLHRSQATQRLGFSHRLDAATGRSNMIAVRRAG